MKNPAYQIGILRDHHGAAEDSNIFELCLDLMRDAVQIKESYNSPASMDARFDELSISDTTALNYAVWHAYSHILEEQNSQAQHS